MLLWWALLTLSGYVLSVPSAVSLRRSPCYLPSHCRPLAPCLSGWFPSLVRVSLLRRGVSPGVGSVGALGELRWLHLYRLTPDLYGLLLFAGCLGCSGWCFLFTVRHSARIHGDHLVSFTDSCVSLARHPCMGLFLGHLHSV